MPLSPLLSVVIPLYDKRVEEEACLESWCRLQTLDRDSFEVIVTSNGEGPKAEERVRQYLKSPDRLVARPGSNMAGLYHAGAEASAAPLIFFTELHCIAEPECLKELLCYLEGKEMAGACVNTYGDYSNVFSSVEAELFDAMFEEWITQNTSKKVLLRGVAIKRGPYFEAGGFRERYNRLCDGLLGARLEELGYELGYAEKAKLQHYYSTRYSQLLLPVREKVVNECTFRLEDTTGLSSRFWGVPSDWALRQNFNPGRGRYLFARLFQSIALKPGEQFRWSPETIQELGYLLKVAGFGLRFRLVLTWLKMARQAIKCWRWQEPEHSCFCAWRRPHRRILCARNPGRNDLSLDPGSGSDFHGSGAP
jgi:hypothetical protein